MTTAQSSSLIIIFGAMTRAADLGSDEFWAMAMFGIGALMLIYSSEIPKDRE